MIGDAKRPMIQPGSVGVGCERRGTQLAGLQTDLTIAPTGPRFPVPPLDTMTLPPAHGEHRPISAALARY